MKERRNEKDRRLWPINQGGSAFIKKSGKIQKNAYSNITPRPHSLAEGAFLSFFPSFLLSFIVGGGDLFVLKCRYKRVYGALN
jgi:hypothetical protein